MSLLGVTSFSSPWSWSYGSKMKDLYSTGAPKAQQVSGYAKKILELVDRVPRMKVVDPKVSSRFLSLLQSTEKTGDITFVVGKDETRVKAHKCIVANSSPALERMLFGTMVEATKKEIRIGDDRLSPLSFGALLEFIYTGETSVTPQNVFGLYSLAMMYDFGTVVDHVRQFFDEYLQPDNCLKVTAEASAWEEGREIVEKATTVLIEYTDSVLESENFLEIDYLLLKHVLTQEKLAVTEVLEWWNLHGKDKYKDIFDQICYVNIPPPDLMRHVKGSIVSDVYLPALEYISAPDDMKADYAKAVRGRLAREKLEVEGFCVERSPTGDGEWSYEGKNMMDAVKFSVSSTVRLIGVGVYTPVVLGPGRAKIAVYKGTKYKKIFADKFHYTSDQGGDTGIVKLTFDKPVKLKNFHFYHLTARVKGTNSRCAGGDHPTEFQVKGVKFTFQDPDPAIFEAEDEEGADLEDNMTTAKEGQFPHLYFKKF